MKKTFKLYAICWFLLLIVFNIIAFVTPAWNTLEKYTSSFWIGYAFISLAFVGQLVCAWIAFKAENAKKSFYNISLFTVSVAGLIATFVVGLICMIISPLPYWVGAIICPLVLVINILAVAKAKIAVDLIAGIDDKIEKATAFIYEMREESETILARAKSDDMKAICKKIRDAFKFSDPMSNTELASVENEIKIHFELLKKAVAEGKGEDVSSESDELLALISERNNKCKRLK